MSKNSGYSREGLFGTITHYDEHGHKTGESIPSLFGGYVDYDASGHRTGRTEEHLIGGGYEHYDTHGHRIGSSDEGLFGGYTERDASGSVTGHRDRSLFDICPEEEILATGSLYGSMYYPGHGCADPDGTDDDALSLFLSTDEETDMLSGDVFADDDDDLDGDDDFGSDRLFGL